MAKCQKMECPIGCKGMERTSDGATKSSNSRSTDWSMRYSPHEAFSRDSGETRPDRRDLSARFFLLPLSRNVLGTYRAKAFSASRRRCFVVHSPQRFIPQCILFTGRTSGPRQGVDRASPCSEHGKSEMSRSTCLKP